MSDHLSERKVKYDLVNEEFQLEYAGGIDSMERDHRRRKSDEQELLTRGHEEEGEGTSAAVEQILWEGDGCAIQGDNMRIVVNVTPPSKVVSLVKNAYFLLQKLNMVALRFLCFQSTPLISAADG